VQRSPARGVATPLEAATAHPSGDRSTFERSPLARFPDPALRYGLTVASAGILVLIVYFFYSLASESSPAFSRFGILGFAFNNNWDIAHNTYGALPLVVGTLITSAVALIIGVPVAVATALYITELSPRRVRAPLTIVVELLAAVPSVVYGLWGFFFLIPKLKPAEQWFADTFSFVPFVGGGGTIAGPNYFITGLILAIMIVPIVSAITREVLTTVPQAHKEAALALGATRWEMIRMAVLPYSRGGIAGASMLGLGRAIGETIAVTIVIGNAPVIGHTLFSQGYSLAAAIANEFGEADAPHRSVLFAAGVLLFVLTLAVNAVARALVHRAERGHRVSMEAALTAAAAAPGGVSGQ
jgi:phosphate ABC transporter permease protein PstC